MSSPGCCRKLRTYTWKELETMWAVPELLGAPNTGGESVLSGSGGGGGHRSQISLPSCPKYMKTVKKRAVSRTFWLINHRKRRFLLKSTCQDILMRCFEKYINLKIVHY
jgi:hypothetical protein